MIALYPYKAQNDDELSFDKDDIISVLGRDEPEWWRGELNGLSGLFPSNYVGPFVTSGKPAKVNGTKTQWISTRNDNKNPQPWRCFTRSFIPSSRSLAHIPV